MACRDHKPLPHLGLPPADVDAVMAAMFDVPAAPGTQVRPPQPTTPPVAVTPTAPPLIAARPPSGTSVTTRPATPPPGKPKGGLVATIAAGAGAGLLVGGPAGAVVGAGAALLLGQLGKK